MYYKIIWPKKISLTAAFSQAYNLFFESYLSTIYRLKYFIY